MSYPKYHRCQICDVGSTEPECWYCHAIYDEDSVSTGAYRGPITSGVSDGPLTETVEAWTRSFRDLQQSLAAIGVACQSLGSNLRGHSVHPDLVVIDEIHQFGPGSFDSADTCE